MTKIHHSPPPAAYPVAQPPTALRNPPLTRPAERSLEGFDILRITASLRQEAALARLQPDQPEYYLRHAWVNSEIGESLLGLSREHEKIEALCRHIDAGEWDLVTPHAARPLNTRDMLFYSRLAGRISEQEFQAGQMALNVKEQFQTQECPPVYRYLRPDGRAKTQLPARAHEVGLNRMFGAGRPTPAGAAYIKGIAANLAARSEGRFAWVSDAGRLTACFLQVPPNLQFFYRVAINGDQRTALQRAHFNARDMPLVVPAPGSPGHDGNVFYCPSPALLDALHQASPPGAGQPAPAVRSIYCLGTLPLKDLADLHRKGFCPVAVYDSRVACNSIGPGRDAGVLFTALQDAHFYRMNLHEMTLEQRELSFETFPLAVERAAGTDNEDLAMRLKSSLILPMPAQADTRNMTPQALFAEACVRTLASPELDREQHARLADLARSSLCQVKTARPALGALHWGEVEETLTRMQRWKQLQGVSDRSHLERLPVEVREMIGDLLREPDLARLASTSSARYIDLAAKRHRAALLRRADRLRDMEDSGWEAEFRQIISDSREGYLESPVGFIHVAHGNTEHTRLIKALSSACSETKRWHLFDVLLPEMNRLPQSLWPQAIRSLLPLVPAATEHEVLALWPGDATASYLLKLAELSTRMDSDPAKASLLTVLLEEARQLWDLEGEFGVDFNAINEFVVRFSDLAVKIEPVCREELSMRLLQHVTKTGPGMKHAERTWMATRLVQELGDQFKQQAIDILSNDLGRILESEDDSDDEEGVPRLRNGAVLQAMRKALESLALNIGDSNARASALRVISSTVDGTRRQFSDFFPEQ